MEHAERNGAFFVRVPGDGDLAFAAPLVRQFWAYTVGCRGDGGRPLRSRFDPVDIPRMLPYLWILDVDADASRLRYRLAGTAMVDALNFDPTGRTVEDLVQDRDNRNSAQTLARYWTSVRDAVATWRRGPARHWRNSDWVVVESLCVPFSVGDARIRQLIGISLRYTDDGEWLDRIPSFSFHR